MSKFKIGDKIRITGDPSDGTDHLDGKIGTVVDVDSRDVAVGVDGSKFVWWIWNYNAKLITKDEGVESNG